VMLGERSKPEFRMSGATYRRASGSQTAAFRLAAGLD
jgi:hypothetical protein